MTKNKTKKITFVITLLLLILVLLLVAESVQVIRIKNRVESTQAYWKESGQKQEEEAVEIPDIEEGQLP